MISLELEQFIDTRSLASLGSLMDTINQQCLPAKTIGVSYRTIAIGTRKVLFVLAEKMLVLTANTVL